MFIIIGDQDSHNIIRLEDITRIEADTLNPNDVNYYIIVHGESICIPYETYSMLISKLVPEDLRVGGYPQCAVCGGYAVAFTDPIEGKQGVQCSKSPLTHEVHCKLNARHCAGPLMDAWIAGDFGDVTSQTDAV